MLCLHASPIARPSTPWVAVTFVYVTQQRKRGKENVKVHDMPSAENNPWKNEKTSSSFQIKRDPIEETFLLHCTMQYFHSVPK